MRVGHVYAKPSVGKNAQRKPKQKRSDRAPQPYSAIVRRGKDQDEPDRRRHSDQDGEKSRHYVELFPPEEMTFDASQISFLLTRYQTTTGTSDRPIHQLDSSLIPQFSKDQNVRNAKNAAKELQAGNNLGKVNSHSQQKRKGTQTTMRPPQSSRPPREHKNALHPKKPAAIAIKFVH